MQETCWKEKDASEIHDAYVKESRTKERLPLKRQPFFIGGIMEIS